MYITIPSKGYSDEHLIILRVELSILMGKKSLHLVGLEPATFLLQGSTLTNRPLVHTGTMYLVRPIVALTKYMYTKFNLLPVQINPYHVYNIIYMYVHVPCIGLHGSSSSPYPSTGYLSPISG